MIEKLRSKGGVRRSMEWERIAALPRRALDLGTVPDLTPVFARERVKCPGCELCRSGRASLRPIQSAALVEAEQQGGLFAPIGVGHGKELICLLLPDVLQSKKAVILTKPRLKAQMIEVDIPRYGRHFKLPLDQITVVSYSELSNAKTADVLDRIEPDLVVANEVHCLRHRSAARTKRFLYYMKDHPLCRFAALSGTIANNSIKDYGHLIELSLRLKSPLPSGWRELEDWSRALDVLPEGEEPMPAGALLDLLGPEVRAEEKESARKIYKRRLTESIGVVATTQGSCEASLTIEARAVEVPLVITETLELLRRKWKLGDEEFSEAMQVAQKARQIATGFYYYWDWPNGEVDTEWLDARTQWFRDVRHVLRYRARPGLDSPLLVANAAERGEIDLPSWEIWKDVRRRWRPHPPQAVKWLHAFVVDDACAWADAVEEDAPGIIWYTDDAIGEALRERGISVYAGGAQGDRILQSRERVVAASVHARRDGDNLQHFRRNLVVTSPANGTIWEQMLGRTHRSGQLADEIECEVNLHDKSLRSALASAIADARFFEETKGMSQKLLLAQYVGIRGLSVEDERWEG